jgi:pimeloyl-ACP methyl ester carboxylesterase
MHGYTGDTSDWRFQIAAFGPTHRVLVMDHRGHGRSAAPADRASYTIEQMSLDAEALITHAGYDRYHLVGHSMGGAIAQEIALRSPERLLSLTLHDTGCFFDPSPDSDFAKYARYRNRIAEEQGMAALAALPSPFKKPPFFPEGREEETRERLARMSADAFIGAGLGLRSWPGTKERLAGLRVPTMVIYGELDAPMLVKSALYMGETIPGAVLEMVPQAAHCPQEERPELFNTALRRHLDRNAARVATAAQGRTG